jgi:hypothetical protein
MFDFLNILANFTRKVSYGIAFMFNKNLPFGLSLFVIFDKNSFPIQN